MVLQDSFGMERIAVKTTCVADLLHNLIEIAKKLDASERRVKCYIRQANLLLLWTKGNAAMKVLGSTAKTVGVVSVVASSFKFNPKLSMVIGIGQKLWKFGTGLKILSNVANVLRDLWQRGCRSCVLDFVNQTTLLVKNVAVFNELVGDLKESLNGTRVHHRLDTPEQIMNLISHYIPGTQNVYIDHVLCMVTGSENYSPLFDFASLLTDPSNNSESNLLQLIREVEGLNFVHFVRESDSNILVCIGSMIHVTRELLDFLDGFSKLTNKDCLFLQQCLSKFTDESMKMKTVVSFLKGLNDMTTALQIVNQVNPVVSQDGDK